MRIIVVGLNHKSAGVEIRERLAFDSEENVRALKELKSKFCESEFVILSTCNRVELYCASQGDDLIDEKELTEFLAEFHDLDFDYFGQYLYVYRDSDAIRHLLKVCSSLDSMVVGESQIISQVRDSYRIACTNGSTGKILNRLFHCAFTVGKKVYTETSISNGRVSVAGVAVELARELFANVSSARVVVIGAGEMAELLIQHFLHVKCKDITILNRSYKRAVDIADRYGVKAISWEELQSQLIGADIVVSAAAAQDYLFEKSGFEKTTANRWGKELLIIDIAVPRNFAPAINGLKEIHLYSIDDLSEVVERNRKARREDIDKAMDIIDKGSVDFMKWLGNSDVGPMIGQMKEKFAQIAQRELEQFFLDQPELSQHRQVAEAMVNRVVGQLLHRVIKNIDEITGKDGPAEAARLIDGIVREAGKITYESDNG
ncbi:glutamyl-tRNA reductase [Planctomycetota bacterium]